MKTLSQETRTETIFRHTNRQIHETRCTWQTFAMRVVDEYHARVPAEARSVIFKVEGDMFRVAATNTQRLHRYMEMDADTRMPVEIEEAWVQALIEPYRTECVRDLARRYGLLDVPIPSITGVSDVQGVSRLSREFGETLESMAPMLDDTRIDAADLPLIPEAMRQLDEMIAAAIAIKARLAAVQAGAARES